MQIFAVHIGAPDSDRRDMRCGNKGDTRSLGTGPAIGSDNQLFPVLVSGPRRAGRLAKDILNPRPRLHCCAPMRDERRPLAHRAKVVPAVGGVGESRDPLFGEEQRQGSISEGRLGQFHKFTDLVAA